MKISANIQDHLRAWPWLLMALLTALVVFFLAKHQVGVLIWSLSKVSIGAYLGYWIDRSIFPGARPADVDPAMQHHARYRRALIIVGVVLALGAGV